MFITVAPCRLNETLPARQCVPNGRQSDSGSTRNYQVLTFELPGAAAKYFSSEPPVRISRANLLLLIGTVLVLLPLLTIKVLPWTDYPVHLAALHVIAHLDDTLLAQYYDINLRILPNSGMEILTYPFAKFLSVYLVGKVFAVFTVIVLISGIVALNRTVTGQASPWPLLALVFVHNGWFKQGTMNYIFGIGAALWALNGYLKLRPRSALIRALFLGVVIPLLFVTHLYSVCLFALGVGSYEVWQSWKARSPRSLYPLACFGLLVPLALAGSSVSERIAFDCETPDGRSSCAFDWVFQDRIEGVKQIYQLDYLPWDSMLDKGVLAVIVALFAWCVWQRRLVTHPVGILILVLVFPIFMALPGTLFQSWGAAQKLPVGVFFLALPFFSLKFDSPRQAGVFASIVLAVTLVRMIDMTYGFYTYRGMQTAYEESFQKMQRGARVLTVDAVTAKDWARGSTTEVWASLCSVERSCLFANNITNPTNQVMKVRPAWKRLDNPMMMSVYPADLVHPIRGTHFENWRKDYNYAYFIHVPKDYRPPVEGMTLIYEYQYPDWVKSFQLYAITQ